MPGGGLEAHESYEQAAVRELREELELPVRQMSELCTINLDNSTEKYFIRAEGLIPRRLRRNEGY